MEFKKLEVIYNDMQFMIEEDYPKAGACLYVYQNNKCIYDYLQNTIQDCKEFALEMFEVPLEGWNEVKP